VGCDGLPESEYLSTPLSTIEFPFKELTHWSWQFLKNRIENPDIAPQRIILNAKLALRESSEG
jgi:DNA-binding LacI/PurR family transcriptional regulator